MQRLRALDERVLGRRAGWRPQRRTVLLYGIAMGALAVVFYVSSFFDESVGRSAALMALYAGFALGRVQEFDRARKGLGLKGEDE